MTVTSAGRFVKHSDRKEQKNVLNRCVTCAQHIYTSSLNPHVTHRRKVLVSIPF